MAFEQAFESVERQFEIEKLLQEQQEAIKAFFYKQKSVRKPSNRIQKVTNFPMFTACCGRRRSKTTQFQCYAGYFFTHCVNERPSEQT